MQSNFTDHRTFYACLDIGCEIVKKFLFQVQDGHGCEKLTWMNKSSWQTTQIMVMAGR